MRLVEIPQFLLFDPLEFGEAIRRKPLRKGVVAHDVRAVVAADRSGARPVVRADESPRRRKLPDVAHRLLEIEAALERERHAAQIEIALQAAVSAALKIA